MQELKNLILSNENWLVKRVLKYALEHNFTKYTSTLEEAWRLSISGLSESIANGIDEYGDVPELDPDDDYMEDPISQFAIIEAIKHRERGIPIGMFLALTKYYKQSYLDLILFKSVSMPQFLEKERLFVERCFDRIEIAYVKKWSETPQDDLIEELRQKNRKLTNEKNKYLTVFESVTDAIILVDSKGVVQNLNHAAAKVINPDAIPGGNYYAPNQIEELESLIDIQMLKDAREIFIGKKLYELYPWLASHKASSYFSISTLKDKVFDNYINGKTYQIYTAGLLDISKKYDNIIIGLRELEPNKGLQNSTDMQQYLDYLINDANIILLGLDSNANVILFNNAAERVTGYKKSEIMNQNWFEKVVPADKFPEVNKVFQKAKERNINQDYFENSIITKSGEERVIIWKNDINTTLYDEFTVFSVGIDVTEHRKEEEVFRIMEKKFETIFDSISDAVALLDNTGRIVHYNYKMKHLINRNHNAEVRDFYHLKDLQINLWEHIKDMTNDDLLVKVINVHDNFNHKFFPAELIVQKMIISEESYFLINIRDISERIVRDELIKETEDKFSLLFESMTQGVTFHDKNGKVLDLNPAAAKIFSIDRNFFNIDNSQHDWLTYDANGNLIEGESALVLNSIKQKMPIYNQEIMVRSEIHSSELWLLISVIPQFNQNGSVKQCWSIFEDITERKHWEQKLLDSEAQFKDLFDKAPVPVLIFETGGRLIDVNQASCALYGFEKNYIAESEYNIYLETEKLKSLDINIDDVFIESQTRNWYEVNFAPKIGTRGIGKVMNIKMYPTKNLAGEINKIICFLEDVSYQKKAKDELARINIDLEKRVSDRTKELNEAKEKIEATLIKKEEYTDLQSRFINMISHEYKTPLTYISSSAAVLEKLIQSNDSEKANDFIRKINSAVNILNHLVDDVMNFVKAENSEVMVFKRTVNIVDYLDRLVKEVKILDKTNHTIKLISDRELFSTMIDLNLFRQIITHILVNAMKFSPENSTIEVVITYPENTFQIEIIDNGIGLAEEDLKYIFTPFYKSKRDIGLKAGTGLGLRLVKKFVDAMGGNISLKSQINKGTAVTVIFPSI